ncbi:hypothetical protein, partial [Achromobacter xylosoxidans]
DARVPGYAGERRETGGTPGYEADRGNPGTPSYDADENPHPGGSVTPMPEPQGPQIILNSASRPDSVKTAARRLGVDLNAVTVSGNGIAHVVIGVTDSLNFSDIQTIVNFVGSMGAKSIEVDSGYLANPKLDALLQSFARSGRPLYGGTVKFNSRSSGDYVITFPVGNK